jgi:hypothetical protein
MAQYLQRKMSLNEKLKKMLKLLKCNSRVNNKCCKIKQTTNQAVQSGLEAFQKNSTKIWTAQSSQCLNIKNTLYRYPKKINQAIRKLWSHWLRSQTCFVVWNRKICLSQKRHCRCRISSM